jgi:hypothetical protein
MWMPIAHEKNKKIIAIPYTESPGAVLHIVLITVLPIPRIGK